jgi:hypothetical protein
VEGYSLDEATHILGGLRIAGGLSLIGAVVAEIAASAAGAGSGLGLPHFRIRLLARRRSRIPNRQGLRHSVFQPEWLRSGAAVLPVSWCVTAEAHPGEQVLSVPV